jgi:hypothetical protein
LSVFKCLEEIQRYQNISSKELHFKHTNKTKLYQQTTFKLLSQQQISQWPVFSEVSPTVSTRPSLEVRSNKVREDF